MTITWIRNGKRHDTKEPLTCKFCGDEMILRWSTIRNHDDVIQEIMRSNDRGDEVKALMEIWTNMPSMYSYVDDMQWKCPTCHKCELFGHPISRKEYDEMRAARGGSTTYVPLADWYADEIIKDRLRKPCYF